MFVTSQKWIVVCRAVFSLTHGGRQRLLDSSCLFVCSSVRLSAWKSSASIERVFIELDIWVSFENMSRKSKFHYKRARKTDTSHGDQCQYTFFIPSRSVLLRMRNVSEKSCRENQNTHFMYYAFFFFFFFSKIVLLWDNVEKYYRVGQATDDNLGHVYCMLATEGYKHTLIQCNTYYFSTATMVAQTGLSVTLRVLCLSFCLLSLSTGTQLVHKPRTACIAIYCITWVRNIYLRVFCTKTLVIIQVKVFFHTKFVDSFHTVQNIHIIKWYTVPILFDNRPQNTSSYNKNVNSE